MYRGASAACEKLRCCNKKAWRRRVATCMPLSAQGSSVPGADSELRPIVNSHRLRRRRDSTQLNCSARVPNNAWSVYSSVTSQCQWRHCIVTHSHDSWVELSCVVGVSWPQQSSFNSFCRGRLQKRNSSAVIKHVCIVFLRFWRMIIFSFDNYSNWKKWHASYYNNCTWKRS